MGSAGLIDFVHIFITLILGAMVMIALMGVIDSKLRALDTRIIAISTSPVMLQLASTYCVVITRCRLYSTLDLAAVLMHAHSSLTCQSYSCIENFWTLAVRDVSHMAHMHVRSLHRSRVATCKSCSRHVSTPRQFIMLHICPLLDRLVIFSQLEMTNNAHIHDGPRLPSKPSLLALRPHIHIDLKFEVLWTIIRMSPFSGAIL